MGLGKFAENIYYGNLPLKIMKKKYGRNDQKLRKLQSKQGKIKHTKNKYSS